LVQHFDNFRWRIAPHVMDKRDAVAGQHPVNFAQRFRWISAMIEGGTANDITDVTIRTAAHARNEIPMIKTILPGIIRALLF
jgi:hypothetical protein